MNSEQRPQGHRCTFCHKIHFTDREFNWLLACRECGQVCGEDYSLLDEVWALTGLDSKGGRLHLKCVEKRIGRKLTLEDFSNFPVNEGIRFGFSLGRQNDE
jgi:hypothetical protein